MTQRPATFAEFWQSLGPRFLPFADAASETLPLGRLLRLSVFQISVGMTAVLLTGTLNRVMILELGVPATVVAVMVALPFLFAPLRALIGYKSDTHRSLLGWRRVPYIWFGTLFQFGGLAIMPFALLLLQSQTTGPQWLGPAGAALAFLLTGLGIHTVQTAGLALATDLAPEDSRPRVVALIHVALLVGMLLSALAFSVLLENFSAVRLIQVVQGAAVAALFFNVIALWKQEARQPSQTDPEKVHPTFIESWRKFKGDSNAARLLIALALGTVGFSMQDVLLEPYGGEVLQLSVAQTTLLTAWFAGGTLLGFALAARLLTLGAEPHRLSALGMLIGIAAFCSVVFAAPLGSANLFRAGACLIGVGGGIFTVGTLIACMKLADASGSGLALGAWGAVQASAVGVGLAAGGIIRDTVNAAGSAGFNPALADPALGYSVVYHLDIAFLVVSIIAIGPLVRFNNARFTEERFTHGSNAKSTPQPLPEQGADIGLARVSS
ncbi:MAG: BCD family MFS transporter [Pseudomonadota bacterium]